MNKKKSRIKKPLYTVRNASRVTFNQSTQQPARDGFYEKHFMAIWVVIIFVVVPALIWLRGSSLEKNNPVSNAGQFSYSASLKESLQIKYSQGYQLLGIIGDKIRPLKLNTFPKTFQANWDLAKILPAKVSGSRDQEADKNVIRIYLPDVYYEPGQFNFVTFDATFSRRVGEVFSIYKNQTQEVTFEILEDFGDRILCVLGVRDIM